MVRRTRSCRSRRRPRSAAGRRSVRKSVPGQARLCAAPAALALVSQSLKVAMDCARPCLLASRDLHRGLVGVAKGARGVSFPQIVPRGAWRRSKSRTNARSASCTGTCSAGWEVASSRRSATMFAESAPSMPACAEGAAPRPREIAPATLSRLCR